MSVRSSKFLTVSILWPTETENAQMKKILMTVVAALGLAAGAYANTGGEA